MEPELPPPPVPVTVTKQVISPRSIVVFLLTLSFIAASVFLGYTYLQLRSQLTTGNQQPTPSQNETMQQSPEPLEETENWETYTNNFFSLKYPNNLVASQSGNLTFLYVRGTTPSKSETFVPTITIGNIYKLPTKFVDISTWAEQNPKIFQNMTNASQTVLGNNTYTTFQTDSGPTAYAIHYLTSDTTNIFDVSVRIVGSNENEGKMLTELLPQILPTFQFLPED